MRNDDDGERENGRNNERHWWRCRFVICSLHSHISLAFLSHSPSSSILPNKKEAGFTRTLLEHVLSHWSIFGDSSTSVTPHCGHQARPNVFLCLFSSCLCRPITEVAYTHARCRPMWGAVLSLETLRSQEAGTENSIQRTVAGERTALPPTEQQGIQRRSTEVTIPSFSLTWAVSFHGHNCMKKRTKRWLLTHTLTRRGHLKHGRRKAAIRRRVLFLSRNCVFDCLHANRGHVNEHFCTHSEGTFECVPVWADAVHVHASSSSHHHSGLKPSVMVVNNCSKVKRRIKLFFPPNTITVIFISSHTATFHCIELFSFITL